jgi:hypothetical protein
MIPRAYLKCVSVALERGIQLRFGVQDSPQSLGITTRQPSRRNRFDQLPQGASRLPSSWGIRYPQWWMLLVAILAIYRFPKADAYSNQGSLLGMQRFAKRQRKPLNELLGTHVANPPSDST